MNEKVSISQPASMASHRFHLLDAQRGLAALQVALLHAPALLKGGRAFENGYLAVDFFFCLSGFVIAFSYEDRLSGGLRLRDFLAARVIRLFPLYLLGSAVAAAQALTIGHMMRHGVSAPVFLSLIFSAVFLLPNLFMTSAGPLIYPFDIPAWSLLFEMAANILFAALLLTRFARSRALAVWAAVSLVILGYVALHTGTLDFGYLQASWPIGFARVGFSFFAGVLLCRLYQHKPAALHGWKCAIASALVAGLLLFTLASDLQWATTGTYRLLAVAGLFPALVLLGASCRLPAACVPICAFLGDMSYPLYVLHSPLLLPLFGRTATRLFLSHPHAVPFLLPLYILLLACLSWWLGRRFDLPLRKRLTILYRGWSNRSQDEHGSAGDVAIRARTPS